jgi:hypothetical protein
LNVLNSYYKRQSEKKGRDSEDEQSDAGSISDTEFDSYLAKTETDGMDGKNGFDDLDFAE